MKINTILIAPVLTQKATTAAQKKVYTFEVDKQSNKNQGAQPGPGQPGRVQRLYGRRDGLLQREPADLPRR